MAAARLVAVGEVLKPHGVGGELKVRPLTDRPMERFRTLTNCILWEPEPDRRQDCHVSSCRFDGELVLLKVDGIDSPEAARRLAGRLLAVDQGQALPTPEGRFYPWQLEGARVETRDGRAVGRFVGIEHAGAQELWVIADGTRERLIPAVVEIVLEVNVAEQRIVIDPPEGLLEL
jgi:16S rRNA processing protein RimM